MDDGGHVFLHLLSRSATSKKEPPTGGFFFVPETLGSANSNLFYTKSLLFN